MVDATTAEEIVSDCRTDLLSILAKLRIVSAFAGGGEEGSPIADIGLLTGELADLVDGVVFDLEIARRKLSTNH